MTRSLFGVLPVVLAVVVCPARAQVTKPGAQQARKLDKQITITVKSNYLLYLPKEYGKDPAKKWPVMLFLHGSGERGTDLNLVKFHGPPKMIQQGKEFEFVVVSPQCPPGEWWRPQTVIALLDDVLEKYKVDRDRVYLTGLSMGGYGTWSTAIEYPDRFAAIAPICGAGNRYLAERIKNVPAWVFHGAKDPAVPVSASEEMVGALKHLGAPDVRYTRYPELAHDCWTETYNNPELYAWFLQHKRGDQPAPGKSAGAK
jgi:predicted peptidase